MLDALKRAQIDVKNKSRLLDNRFGDNSPVNNDLLPNMPKGSAVIVSEDVGKIMKEIQRLTSVHGKEIPFLLLGRDEDPLVFFDKIIVDMDVKDMKYAEANFAKLLPRLEQFVQQSKKDGTDIVAHGHSHPKSINNYHRNFSLGDMDAYKNFRLDNNVFRTGKIELCSCLLTDGNYNFLFFDGNDYYKFNDVFVQNKNGDFVEKLPCYKQGMQYTYALERE